MSCENLSMELWCLASKCWESWGTEPPDFPQPSHLLSYVDWCTKKKKSISWQTSFVDRKKKKKKNLQRSHFGVVLLAPFSLLVCAEGLLAVWLKEEEMPQRLLMHVARQHALFKGWMQKRWCAWLTLEDGLPPRALEVRLFSLALLCQ